MATRIIVDFIEEYWLIFRLHFLSIIKTVPTEWQVGDKGNVILLPGFGETWYFVASIASELNRLGYKIHTIKQFEYNTLPLRKCVPILRERIEQKQLNNCILLSHSKGGLIAKLYLDTYPNENIARSFSIATPYQGTLLGYLRVGNLWELIPGSPLIQQALAKDDNLGKIINIYTQHDNHTLPSKNAILPNALNKQIPITGHTRIIKAKQTLEIVKGYLQIKS